MKLYIVVMTEHVRRYKVVEVTAKDAEEAEDIAAEIYENEGSDEWDEADLKKLNTKVVWTLEEGEI